MIPSCLPPGSHPLALPAPALHAMTRSCCTDLRGLGAGHAVAGHAVARRQRRRSRRAEEEASWCRAGTESQAGHTRRMKPRH
eukprot:538100-Hanusia_phi.AAC.1